MKKQGKRREVVGTVLSNKMDKTIIVTSEKLVKHRLYHKYVRNRSKYAAHDEANVCQIEYQDDPLPWEAMEGLHDLREGREDDPV